MNARNETMTTKKPKPPQGTQEIKKEFIKTIQQLSHSRHAWDTWQDFTQLTALAIRQKVEYSDTREEEYMRTVGRYTHEEAQLFPNLLALTIQAIATQYQDFLGQVFMELELGSHWAGQFFTPYHICKMSAQVTVSIDQFEDNKIVSVNDPTIGAGAFMIALCDYLNKEKINYPDQLKIVGRDISYVACCMSYIQLSIIGCSAIIILGDTLKNECRDTWITPMGAMQYSRHWSD